ncbi:MAG: lysylphosphatidylglycerol synthase domain-containing protein [Armatimonadota bacterium]
MTRTPDDSGSGRGLRSILKRIGVTLLVLGLLAWVLHRAWREAATIDWDALQVQPALIVLSVVAVVLAWGWHGVVWAVMVRGLGYDLSTPVAIRAALVGNLGNYIPGKVFIVIFRAKLVECEAVPAMIVASSVVLETLLRNMVAALLAVFGLWHLGMGGSYIGGLALMLGISVIVVHPAVFNRLTDFVLRRLKRPPLPRHLSLRRTTALLAGYVVYWTLYVLAFFLLTRGTLGAEVSDIPALAVALFLTLIASMLAVFTPVGLGVADATLASVLGLTGAVPGAAVLAVIVRVWRTLTEVGVAGIGWLLPIDPGVSLSDAVEDEEDVAVEYESE